jgi:hypothetical protein
MQTYAQRTLQSRIKGAGDYMTTQTTELGSTKQYEPYYLDSQYDVTKDDSTTEINDGTLQGVRKDQLSNTIRATGGFKAMSFNTTGITQED